MRPASAPLTKPSVDLSLKVKHLDICNISRYALTSLAFFTFFFSKKFWLKFRFLNFFFQAENETKISELKAERVTLEAEFNAFKYSDADSIAKADSEFNAVAGELDQQKKLTIQYQEKLERQNSKFSRTFLPIKIASLFFSFFNPF